MSSILGIPKLFIGFVVGCVFSFSLLSSVILILGKNKSGRFGWLKVLLPTLYDTYTEFVDVPVIKYRTRIKKEIVDNPIILECDVHVPYYVTEFVSPIVPQDIPNTDSKLSRIKNVPKNKILSKPRTPQQSIPENIPQQDKSVLELHKKGYSIRMIGNELGFSHTKARRILKKHGVVS